MRQIIIPMAGRGVRFREQGYMDPKPLLPVFGKPMIARVLENLSTTRPSEITLVHSEATIPRENLTRVVRAFCPRCQIITLAQETEGALITVLLGIEHLDPKDELLIANSDQLVSFDFESYLDSAQQSEGNILTFTATDSRWSFVKTDETGRALKVAEKEVISNEATVGIYYFRSVDLFRTAAQKMITANDRVRGEFYVAPVYNWLPLQTANVRTYRLKSSKAMHGLGTPEDYLRFLETNPMDLT